MFRIDSEGATEANLFTEGNPATSVPATVVSADWLNSVQEEICQFIENQGLTLAKADDTQFEQAMRVMMLNGAPKGQEIDVAIANNSGPTSVSGLDFAKATYKGGRFDFNIHRRTDTQSKDAAGHCVVSHDTENDTWSISEMSHFDSDHGVTFSITSAGQIQVTMNELTGANYTGVLRVHNVKKILQ